MFPEEIIKILSKYQDENSISLNNINNNISKIIDKLYIINQNLAEQIKNLVLDKDTDNNADEIMKDSKILRDYIKSIKLLEVKEITTNNLSMETSEEIFPSLDNEFDEYTHIHICCTDMCTKCKEKLDSTNIYYQRKFNDIIKRESISGFRCPNCGSLYMFDYEMQIFDCDNTNIEIHTRRYNKLCIQDEVFVITDINKCSSKNHDIEDIIGSIPIIDADGNITFTYVDISYCRTCHKYIMLKNTYQEISNFLACQVIDETREKSVRSKLSSFGYDTTGSKLSQLGYNVNCVDKLTEQQRETLLSAILSSKILTKGEIVGNIDRNISSGRSRIGSKKDWSNAVEKWEHDKKFVQSFDIEHSKNDININKIILKYRKNI